MKTVDFDLEKFNCEILMSEHVNGEILLIHCCAKNAGEKMNFGANQFVGSFRLMFIGGG